MVWGAALLAASACDIQPAPPPEQSAHAEIPVTDASRPPTERAVPEGQTPGGTHTGPQPAVPGVERPDGTLMGQLRQALAAKGASYVPRTRHKQGAKPRFINRLILETSPYLLQHAHNPVNWYPWGDAAFERARREGKPVLLSVGYSTCHWCHVMEEESFEDLEIAEYINRNYIAIKVDREERPDVDRVYMDAVQLLTGRGGWPMTVLLTPERAPFFGGTYFPPRAGVRNARAGFIDVLKQLKTQYDEDPEATLARAEEVTRRMQAAARPGRPGDVPGPEALGGTARYFAKRFDPVWGGFGGDRNKFPRPVSLDFLLRYHRRTGDAQALHMVTHTLEKMADGGMYDHLAGGFHRYSTDKEWLVPHFEKMLYDNGQLASLYLQGWQLTGNARFARVTTEILDYVAREMTDTGGAFWSATDADSPVPGQPEHREEGLFFTWTPAEIDALLGPEEAAAVKAYYAVSAEGNFEGRSILHTPRPKAQVAAELRISVAELNRELTRARRIMYTARQKRQPPLTDRKVIAAWNGLMISAFAQAGLALERRDYVFQAQRAADFILSRMLDERGRLLRTFNAGEARHAGVLNDYACMVQGLLDLFEAGGRVSDLEAAKRLQGQVDALFAAPTGGYFETARDAERMLTRRKPDYDGAEPSGNSVTAMNLLRFEAITGEGRYREQAERLFKAFADTISRRGPSAPLMTAALERYLDTTREVVIVAPTGGDTPDLLQRALGRTYLPNRLVVLTTEGVDLKGKAAQIPLLKGKVAQKGLATAYVCERGTCERPTADPAVLSKQLARVQPLDAQLPPLTKP